MLTADSTLKLLCTISDNQGCDVSITRLAGWNANFRSNTVLACYLRKTAGDLIDHRNGFFNVPYCHPNLVFANVAPLKALRNRSSANESRIEQGACFGDVIDKTMQKIASSRVRCELARDQVKACAGRFSEVKSTMSLHKELNWLIGKPLSSLSHMKSFYEFPTPELTVGSTIKFDEIGSGETGQLKTIARFDQATHQDTHQDYVYSQPGRCSGDGR